MSERTLVEMTLEEKAELEAFRKEKERKAAIEAKRKMREDLQELTDEVMGEAFADLEACSEQLKECREEVWSKFGTLLEMRREVNTEAGKTEQNSYTFTTSDGSMRIEMGYNMLDAYMDGVEEGIAKVKKYMNSLAKDEKSQVLVDSILRLLSRDQAGNLKASRVLQLARIAKETGDEEFIEGIDIIQSCYRPVRSKRYIRARRKKSLENGEAEWVDLPLSITEN